MHVDIAIPISRAANLYLIRDQIRFTFRPPLARNRPAIYHRYCFIYRTVTYLGQCSFMEVNSRERLQNSRYSGGGGGGALIARDGKLA